MLKRSTDTDIWGVVTRSNILLGYWWRGKPCTGGLELGIWKSAPGRYSASPAHRLVLVRVTFTMRIAFLRLQRPFLRAENVVHCWKMRFERSKGPFLGFWALKLVSSLSFEAFCKCRLLIWALKLVPTLNLSLKMPKIVTLSLKILISIFAIWLETTGEAGEDWRR